VVRVIVLHKHLPISLCNSLSSGGREVVGGHAATSFSCCASASRRPPQGHSGPARPAARRNRSRSQLIRHSRRRTRLLASLTLVRALGHARTRRIRTSAPGFRLHLDGADLHADRTQRNHTEGTPPDNLALLAPVLVCGYPAPADNSSSRFSLFGQPEVPRLSFALSG
jgi:hypothetical protein